MKRVQTTKYSLLRDKKGRIMGRSVVLSLKSCLFCNNKFQPGCFTDKYCNRECYFGMKRLRGDRVNWTDEMKDRVRKSKLGSNNPMWRGGVTSERVKECNTSTYKNWRKSIFERDDFTCQLCGKRGLKINADHIIPWWKSEELRFSLDNGRTLCVACHREKTRQEMKENWINQYTCAYAIDETPFYLK